MDEVEGTGGETTPERDEKPTYVERVEDIVPPKSRNWGGKRAGAGAPKGNLNGWRHGRNSYYHKQLVHFLAQIPEAEKAMVRIARRRRKKDREVALGATEFMAEVCRRVGEIILNPEANQLESNQEFLTSIARLQGFTKAFLNLQSSEKEPKWPSIKSLDD